MNYKLFLLAFLGAIGTNSKVFAAHHAAHHAIKTAIGTTLRDAMHQYAEAVAGATTGDLIEYQATRYVLGFRHTHVDVNPGATDLPAYIKKDISYAKDFLKVARMSTVLAAEFAPLAEGETLDDRILKNQVNALFKSFPPIDESDTEPLSRARSS